VDAVDRWTIGSLLETAAGYLREKGFDSPRLDAELLLAECLGVDRVRLYIEFDRPLTAGEVDRYRALIARRAAHEPIAYITGRAYFRRLCLEVTPAVLVPRPETEELVEVALDSLRRRPALTIGAASGGEAGRPPLVADVGTGSGAIALSLAQEAGVSVLAIDASSEALEVAARNAALLGLAGLVRFAQADLLATVAEHSLHLVVSNPPYVRSGDLAALPADIRLYEPKTALDGGPDGLAVIRRLLPQAARALRPGGSLVIEVGDGQAEAVARPARDAGFSLVTVHKDISQKDRIVEATLPGALRASCADLDDEQASVVREALRAGAVIGVPTDTVYGIAARWDSAAGVRRLFAAKGRPAGRPVQVLFSSVEAIRNAVPDLDEASARVLEALLPGPFTFVVATTVARPPYVGTAGSLGVRVPDHPSLLRLLSILDMPLAATSANPSGDAGVGTSAEVDPWVLAHCSIVFTDGDGAGGRLSAAGVASTVVDLRPLALGGPALVVREGAVAGAAVMERIGALR